MKLIGLDLSLSATGFAVWNDGAISFDVIHSLPDKSAYGDVRRLQAITKQVAEVARGSSLATIEGPAFGRPQQAIILGGLAYMVRAWLYCHEIPYILIAPGTLKKFITGQGNAKKDMILREVFRRWGVETDDHNIADAYGLLRIGMGLSGSLEGLTGFQEEVLANVKRRNTDVDFEAFVSHARAEAD